MKTVGGYILVLILAVQNQPPQFKSGVELVTIHVSVLADDGTPVANLRPEQFLVRVDGVARPMASLQFVRLPAIHGEHVSQVIHACTSQLATS
ncbi:MAG: hypothetical protein WBC51_23630 [Vicinamibacterales bacterium]